MLGGIGQVYDETTKERSVQNPKATATPEHAQPLGLLHCLSREMQLSPHGFPVRQTRQHDVVGSVVVQDAEPKTNSIARATMTGAFISLEPPAVRERNPDIRSVGRRPVAPA